MKSLYDPLGGSEGIRGIADDLVSFHLQNPKISSRSATSDVEVLKNAAATFFIAGSGGPQVYKGKDMLSAHRGMNINEVEFMAVLDDALIALDKHGVGQREKEEVLLILYSMRGDVIGG